VLFGVYYKREVYYAKKEEKMSEITFSEQLKKERKRTGLSAEKFAVKLDIPANTYRDWETGRSQPPAYSMPMILDAIERALIKSEFEKNDWEPGEKGSFSREREEDKPFHLIKGQVYDMYIPVGNIESLAKYHQVPDFPRALIRTIVHDDGEGGTAVDFYTGFEHYGSPFFQVGVMYDPKSGSLADFITDFIARLKDNYFRWDEALEYCASDFNSLLYEYGIDELIGEEPSDYDSEDAEPVSFGTSLSSADTTITGIFARTLRNCEFFENEGGVPIHLANEIGVLRGVSYCMEVVGVCPHTPDFMHFIEEQQRLKAGEEEEMNARWAARTNAKTEK